MNQLVMENSEDEKKRRTFKITSHIKKYIPNKRRGKEHDATNDVVRTS